jgi:hypothetical protein
MATTTNYGWTTPNDTDLVKDGAAAIRTLGSSIDTTTKALNPSTTLGDLEYRSATANTNTRLAIGSTGQVLTVAGGVPSWATAASGGMTLLSTTTLSGTSTTISGISGSHNNLQLVIRGYQPSTTAELSLQINGNTGTVYGTQQNNSGASGTFYATSGRITEQAITAVTRNGIVIDFIDYANSSTYKPITSYAIVQSAATPAVGWTISKHLINDINAITSITLITSTGTMSGTALLYGVK